MHQDLIDDIHAHNVCVEKAQSSVRKLKVNDHITTV